MPGELQLYKVQQPTDRMFSWADVIIIAFLVALLFLGLQLAYWTPKALQAANISLAYQNLPWYAALSTIRMALAYVLSLLFSFIYGRVAAFNKRAGSALIPLLDVLQSIPILSFLPVFLLSLTAILPRTLAIELASIGLIFTSMAWNITYSWYQSLITLPKDLLEANAIFRLNPWFRMKKLELPFAAIGLIWNSMMSWAGGWFFLMAAESFTVGERDYRLPGLGSYLHEAANRHDWRAIILGLVTLVIVIVLLDQLVWRPLSTWSSRFKLEMVEDENLSTSWFLNVIRSARMVQWFAGKPLHASQEALDRWSRRRFSAAAEPTKSKIPAWLTATFLFSLLAGLLFAGLQAAGALVSLPAASWAQIGVGLLATFLRVLAALLIAMLWTIPAGVLIGANSRLREYLQPVVQILAAIPATALFPVILLFVAHWTGGLNLAAILLMLLGTQWYLLFNIIAGASTIPQDLKYTSRLLQLTGWQYWKTLILPALFPFFVTGAITAAGGAWNASIVAEYVSFTGKTYKVPGIGSTIAEATADGNYTLLLASTMAMILAVILINRFFWRRLFVLANERYRLE